MFQRYIIRPLDHLGSVLILTVRIVIAIFSTQGFFKKVIDQCYLLGIRSFFATVVTAMFIGMVFTLQIINEFEKFGAKFLIGGIIGLAVWRELGPLLTAVVVSGRVGAAISSEIATMKVSEQIEALESLSLDPVKVLLMPRVVATTIMLPLLVCVADLVGFFSGMLVSKIVGNINRFVYLNSAQVMLTYYDILGGLIKAVVFGFALSVISCYFGYYSSAGAKGVGKATTRSVVVSLMVIFVLNYFLTMVLF